MDRQIHSCIINICILLGFTYMQEVHVCVFWPHLWVWVLVRADLIPFHPLYSPAGNGPKSYSDLEWGQRKPTKASQKDANQRQHFLQLSWHPLMSGVWFCSSKTNHLYKVQGLTVWFKMSWYTHFIFCCLAGLYSYLLVATWVFECMYSKYDVCAVFSLVTTLSE